MCQRTCFLLEGCNCLVSPRLKVTHPVGRTCVTLLLPRQSYHYHALWSWPTQVCHLPFVTTSAKQCWTQDYALWRMIKFTVWTCIVGSFWPHVCKQFMCKNLQNVGSVHLHATSCDWMIQCPFNASHQALNETLHHTRHCQSHQALINMAKSFAFQHLSAPAWPMQRLGTVIGLRKLTILWHWGICPIHPTTLCGSRICLRSGSPLAITCCVVI